MCSLHCRCMEGRKLKVSCVAKHPPQVYSCSWISCLSAPHSTSWSRLEFFCPLGVSGKEGWSQSGYFFKRETGDQLYGFLGYPPSYSHFFWGRWWKMMIGSLDGSWGFLFSTKAPGDVSTAAGAVALASPPCWAVARSDFYWRHR